MDVEVTPRPSRVVVTLRIFSAILATAAATLLGLVLSLGIWILASDLDKPNPKPLAVAVLAVLTLGIVGCVLCLVCRVTAKVTFSCLILCAGLLAFLALDDFHRPPEPEFGPVAAPGSPEYRAYMQMSKDTPESITAAIALPLDLKELFITAKPEDWDTFLTSNRARILQEWKGETLGRSWVEDLAALPSTAGTIAHRRIDDPLIAFQPVRVIASRHLAYALLLAKDGRTEEAAVHLRTLLRACYALERIGVGPVDEMIGNVVEKKVYAAIRFLLDQGPLTAAPTTSLAQVLEAAPGIHFMAQRTILGDLQAQRDITDRALANAVWQDSLRPVATFRKQLASLACFVLHPYRMERERIHVHTKMAAGIAARRLDAAKTICDDYVGLTRSFTSLRNPAGRKLAAMATPSFSKVGANLWTAEDERLALIVRLKGVPTAAPQSAVSPSN